MANIALFIYGIGDLKGGGGAERFFADFFTQYQTSKSAKHNLFYIIDKRSVNNLNEVNKLKGAHNLLFFKTWSNRFKHKLEVLQLTWFIVIKKIKLIHIPLYDTSYIPLLEKLNILPAMIRPKLVINIVNCYVAQILSDPLHKQHTPILNTYSPLFNKIKVDGYFCWNRSFEDHARSQVSFTYAPKLIYSITSRFSDTLKFFPANEKQDLIVFASRLDLQKHADWFIKAIEILKNKNVVKEWKFILCGNGELRSQLQKTAEEKKLNDVVEFRIEGQMQNIFNRSKVYVSCQDYDNFPSLSMAEAMASGNAIIARNVGQTNLFLKDKVNGFLIDPDNEIGLAKAMEEYITNPSIHERMSMESVKLTKKVHTFDNFKIQIESFWDKILS